MGDYSRFLIPEAGFAEGAGRILDFDDVLNAYNFSENPEDADTLAIWSDWKAVGADLQKSFDRYGAERDICRKPQGGETGLR